MRFASRLPVAAAACAMLSLSACAPDALDNLQATGFNAYLNTLQNECENFRIGSHDLHNWLQYNGGLPRDKYDYWLDQTSRLYYRQITMEAYRSGVETFLGSGPDDAASLDCIERHLPADRPAQKGLLLP
ncbi:hypothetical protein ACDA63_10915 [Uliginosibacterium sp. sgz301328]|uniref:hypothetical protein n=1 Tax=Uliginosibacterium sp. sgz301328 TaxID=3243764 RepID=UPI00359D84B1